MADPKEIDRRVFEEPWRGNWDVIETFVYRGGDQLAAWGYAGLTIAGLGLAGISWVAVPLSAAWVALAIWLGRRQSQLAAAEPPRNSSMGGPPILTLNPDSDERHQIDPAAAR